MPTLLDAIFKASKTQKKLLAVLIDPEKFSAEKYEDFIENLPEAVTHVFVGGSTVTTEESEICVDFIKSKTKLPVILFPGDKGQITEKADGILLLSLLSGRNPEYLIEQHIKAVPKLLNSGLEIIPTGYLLLNGGNQSAVARVSKTQPIDQNEIELIKNTALAGQMMGKQLIYLEAGSGAKIPVFDEVIAEVKKDLSIPLIVGGGIRNAKQLEKAYKAGADLVVIGTAFENGEFIS
ncbi:geranylgeranylglyceryl/heptaprenylglyceryl phosphate synthase [Zunongwangia sp. HGR-M22]|uniref:geranylgeranylglyceryl/heptaprenylglyceryl phosphate synthase n=1 Tax=Zunongwangia sp. HGR-M22 TaxID=3015168 RepID=UPI0022DE1C5D|nr:geranylgeranylglyceryl/heptaprenylglyceryl phosphate synthase [Zunongwangia sp. HGR-M22]WBL25385.1 geranylgeranylglyceryl/heptaprenylglyceryl phosphate synthase [Zunongwangia sp. HGR-M22]